jgi:hypothetical protein
MNRSSTEFFAFNFKDSTNQVVLKIHLGRREATEYSFTRGTLAIEPE